MFSSILAHAWTNISEVRCISRTDYEAEISDMTAAIVKSH